MNRQSKGAATRGSSAEGTAARAVQRGVARVVVGCASIADGLEGKPVSE
jgi:hypothetical protein